MDALPGTWLLNGHPFLTLEADGSGVMEGESFQWRAEGNTLFIDAAGLSERAVFQLAGDVLVIQLGGMPMHLQRVGRAKPPAPRASSPRPGPTPPRRGSTQLDPQAEALRWLAERLRPGGPGGEGLGGPVTRQAMPPAPTPAGGDQLAQLLTSSSWCWMEYRSGNTYSGKLHFGRDGTWQDRSENEIYSHNPYQQSTAHLTGSHANGGRWEVRQGQLYMSSAETGGQLVPIPLTVTFNSNGAPILTANGREYCQCG